MKFDQVVDRVQHAYGGSWTSVVRRIDEYLGHWSAANRSVDQTAKRLLSGQLVVWNE